ncbi:hypothetical protein RI103_15905 [Paraburkholderia sp. FT54]|uniref:hypothetical protein n=1 Tax=Paraburkholderia sp. FT54 TaxID=3074437 RepID=UPI0028773AC4|nr:hypothetical protein [Paraburkholderia sp. FT54]WNC89154.1 hypothetical protein RI103_15905 [Paraburkholderia sp. FT54]
MDGDAIEQLAESMGEGVGGFLNPTFGNVAELIIAFVALYAGLHQMVEASIISSIVGNMLLLFGAAMLAGGNALSRAAQPRSDLFSGDLTINDGSRRKAAV